MVYSTEWPVLYKWVILGEESGDRVYLRYLDLFLEFHSWEYPCKSLGEHSLTTPWWSLEEDIVPTCCGYEERSLGMFLADDMREVHSSYVQL
jgi:hypothetical protein